MRTVEASRFVRATEPEVSRYLTPETIIGYEGTFTVRDVEERDGETHVVASATGMTAAFAFTERDDGLRYEQVGDAGPFDAMTTAVSVRKENEGVRVTMRSSVSLGLPVKAITDRVAAWKRRGELKRALSRLAADVE